MAEYKLSYTASEIDAKLRRVDNIKDGEDGADGKDGVSATHSWNGTILTITSASGTSSADLKGAKGDKGDPGDDYTLTDADKQEIAGLVEIPATELITLANYGFTTSDGTTTSFNDVIAMMLNISLQAGGNLQTMSGTDVDGSLFSAVGSTNFNVPMFLANFGVGIVLWKPEMLFIADSEFQLSFSSFIKLANVGNVEVKLALNLFSDKTADIFLRASVVSA